MPPAETLPMHSGLLQRMVYMSGKGPLIQSQTGSGTVIMESKLSSIVHQISPKWLEIL